MSDLKPCPFCGGSPVLDGKSDDVRVRCEDGCGALGQIFYFDGEDDEAIEQAVTAARDAWNRRAAPPAEAQWPGLIEWLASGDRGLSSDQIVTSLCGLDARSKSFRDDHPSYPRDPDDLARCLKLLDAVPALNQNFHRMALVSKEWAALVAFWDDLVAVMILEAPRFRTQGRAPKTYALMKAALAGTKEGEK